MPWEMLGAGACARQGESLRQKGPKPAPERKPPLQKRGKSAIFVLRMITV